jgi:hypothetical protein
MWGRKTSPLFDLVEKEASKICAGYSDVMSTPLPLISSGSEPLPDERSASGDRAVHLE